MSKDNILLTLQSSLPPVFARKEISRLTGGLISPRHLANLDSAGLGPKGKVRVGRKIGYERDAFVSWMSERMQDVNVA